MLDDRTAANPSIDPLAHVVWNDRSNAAGWEPYLVCPAGAGCAPEFAVAARCEDLHGLPTASISVGSLDLFAAECRSYARRLHEAGGSVTLEEALGAFHDFATLVPEADVSKVSARRHLAFLRRVLVEA